MQTRLALGVEYDGTDFKGWQIQSNGRSVQGCLQQALSSVADSPVQVVGAGRTDAGVHALTQVAHFDTQAQRSVRQWLLGANANLPCDVSVRWVRAVAPDFHARFSALARAYRYLILNRATRPAISRHRACWIHQELNEARMREASRYFLGEQDFSALRAAGCQAKSPIRNLHTIEVTREGEVIIVDVAANAFLQHMVRNIAGVLIKVGKGEAESQWAQQVLEGRDRAKAGITAPAGGLYLTEIRYSDEFGLPAMAPPVLLPLG